MSTIVPVPVPLGVHGGRRIPLKVGSGKTVSLGMDTAVRPALTPHYTSDYEVTPTESEQTLQTTGLLMDDDVTVHGISADYVGSAIERRDSSDLSASGPTVSVPAGYYENSATKSVSTTTHPDPTASVDSSGLVTATHTQTEGYVSAGTTTGTLQLTTQAGYTVTPTESEQTAVEAARFTTGDVKVGGIPSDYVGTGITRRDSSDLSASGATVTAPAGYYSESASKAVASGSVTAPSSISGTSASLAAYSNVLTLSKTVSVTPNVTTAGWITAGTAGNVAVSLSAPVTTKAGETITPGTSDRTLAAGTYLTGNQVIKGDPDLIAANISENANIFGVQGTLPVYPDGDLLGYGDATAPMVGAGQADYAVI